MKKKIIIMKKKIIIMKKKIIMWCIIFLCLIPGMVLSGEINYKFGPLLHEKINQVKTEKLHQQSRQPFSPDQSTDRPSMSGDLTKVIVVMDRHHLSDLSQAVLDELEIRVKELGGYIGDHAFNNVQVFLHLEKIKDLAAWHEIKIIKLPTPAGTNSGYIQSEGLSVGNINNWTSYGISGNGVKVGVLDTGFKGYYDLVGRELPVDTTASYTGSLLNFNSDVHGTACAEIIHDIAPGAGLYLVNAYDMDVDYRNAVDWLTYEDVDIISCSIVLPLLYFCEIIYFMVNSSTYNIDYWITQSEQLEMLNQQVNHVTTQAVVNDITWIQSANNYARQRWKGVFNDPDNDNAHNFSNGSNYNELILPSYFQYGKEVYVVMAWGDDFDTYDDYDLTIVDEYGNTVTYSDIGQSEIPIGVEACKFTPVAGRKYYLQVIRYWATVQEITILVGVDDFAQLQDYSPESTVSLAAPCDNPDVITVGAVPYNNPYVIEDFSGRGPGDGGIIKPDLVAPDRVSTASYGRPFYGTSAAAPHVAGVSALIKQRYPSYSPQQIKNYLESNAMDLGTPGKDNVFGSGLVQLPDMITCTYSIAPVAGSFSAGGGTCSVSVMASNSGCSWTASESLSWVSLSPVSGTGSRNVTITVGVNTGAARSGSITIAGKTYTISQAAGNNPGAGLTQTQVSQLYVSIFNRASEGEGNTYWQSQPDMVTAATAMLDTNAARDYFGSNLNTNQAFIEHIYLNTLNKTIWDDFYGIAYWVNLLDFGISRGKVVADLVGTIKDYAPGGRYYDPYDNTTVAAYNQFTNRVIVSDYMADTVEALPVDWETSTSFNGALIVTFDSATVAAAKAKVDLF